GGILSASVAAAVTLGIMPDNDAPRIEQLASFPIVQPSVDPRPLPFQTTVVAPFQPEAEYPPREISIYREPTIAREPGVEREPGIERERGTEPEASIENVPLPQPRPKPTPARKVASTPKKNTALAYAPVECGWDKYKNKVPKWMRKCPGAPMSLA